jgi:hypothetical protein
LSKDNDWQRIAEAWAETSLAAGVRPLNGDDPRFVEFKRLGERAEQGDAAALEALRAYFKGVAGQPGIWAAGGVAVGLAVTYFCRTKREEVIGELFEFMGTFPGFSSFEYVAWRLQDFERAAMPAIEHYLASGNETQRLMALDLLANFCRERIAGAEDIERMAEPIERLERHPNETVQTMLHVIRQYRVEKPAPTG